MDSNGLSAERIDSIASKMSYELSLNSHEIEKLAHGGFHLLTEFRYEGFPEWDKQIIDGATAVFQAIARAARETEKAINDIADELAGRGEKGEEHHRKPSEEEKAAIVSTVNAVVV